MAEKKQTAVEWLEAQTRRPEWHSLKRGEIFEQAKELEKQQSIDDYINGMYKGQEIYFGEHNIKLDVNHLEYSEKIAEQYYNETFGELPEPEPGKSDVSIRLIDVYIKETGKSMPSDQIALHEWNREYQKWLEGKVVECIGRRL